MKRTRGNLTWGLVIFLIESVFLGSIVTWLTTQLPTGSALLPVLAIPISYVSAVLAVILLKARGDPFEWNAFSCRS